MRIAIYHNLPSGGAKRALHEAVRRMSTRHQVDIYTLSSADLQFADLRPYASRHQVYTFDPMPLLRSPFGRANQIIRMADLRRLRALGRHVAADIGRRDYDAAFIHPCMFEIAPSVLRYLRALPAVYFCQEPPRQIYESMPDRPYARANTRRAALDRLDPLPGFYRSDLARSDRVNTRSATRVLVNSRFVKGSIDPLYDINARVCYLGVDTEWARPDGRERQQFVLSVGSLTPLKGFDFLIRALGHIPTDRRPPLVIASNFQNPPEKAYLQDLANSMGVELRLKGMVSEAELADLYRSARLVAYAPVHEPFGLVALEAMASATPIVAVAEGGIPESVLHERTGLLASRDVVEFSNALLRLYENHELAERLGAAGREHVLQHWTWDRAIANLEAELQSLVAVPSGTAMPAAAVGGSR